MFVPTHKMREKSMSYSPEMIAELQETAVWDYEKATAFAIKHMQKPRSVVAKVMALGLEYKKAGAASPTKKPAKTTKAELVAAVEAKLMIRAPSLDKVNMGDLTLILEALND